MHKIDLLTILELWMDGIFSADLAKIATLCRVEASLSLPFDLRSHWSCRLPTVDSVFHDCWGWGFFHSLCNKQCHLGASTVSRNHQMNCNFRLLCVDFTQSLWLLLGGSTYRFHTACLYFYTSSSTARLCLANFSISQYLFQIYDRFPHNLPHQLCCLCFRHVKHVVATISEIPSLLKCVLKLEFNLQRDIICPWKHTCRAV